MKLKEKDTFLEIVDKIADIIGMYELRNIDKNIIKVCLANGDYIEYRIAKESIAHLLGVNTNTLIATGLFNNTNSFEVLKEMINKKNYLADMICNEHLTIKSIFSEYIIQKLDSFFNNIFIDINNTVFVCKYDKDIAINNGVVEPHKCQYIICKEDNEHNFYVLHLVKYSNFYVPMSNRVFDDIEEANDYLTNSLTNQTITFINCIIIKREQYDNGTKIFLRSLDKRQHLLTLQEFSSKFNANIDISDDYQHELKANATNFNKSEEQASVISYIVKCISSNTLIDPSLIPDKMIPIIEALNNYTAMNSGSEETFTSLASQIKALQEAKSSIEQQCSSLQEELTRANLANEALTSRNQQLEEAIGTIGKAYQKTLKQN